MDTPVDQKSRIMPTIEINQRIQNKHKTTGFYAAFFICFEVLLISGMFLFLYQLRTGNEFDQSYWSFSWSSPRLSQYFIFFALSLCFTLIFFYRYKIHTFRAHYGLLDELYKMIKSYSFSILITIGISFLLKLDDFSRIVIVAYWLAAILLSGLIRIVKRQFFFRAANKGTVSKNVIIVGFGKVGKSLIDEMIQNRWLGYRVVGFVDDLIDTDYKECLYLGKTTDIGKTLQFHEIDEIIVTIPSERRLVDQLISDFRKINIDIKIVPDLYNLVMSTVQIGSINALPVVSLVRTPMRGIPYLFKRIFDFILSSLLIIFISPVLLITMLAIKLDSQGNIFYKQKRIGKNGKLFDMYKFRSMVTNAEQMQQQIQQLNESDGIAFKMKNDPRVTKVGQFIRKYSIDELPQLFNVLKGDMSLVGPRPPLSHEVERYGNLEWKRLEVLPGMTGLWQVSGRSDLSFQQWMNLDIYYIENWSIGLDIKILFKTIPAVFKGEGAY